MTHRWILLLVFPLSCLGQEFRLTGRVSGASDQPLSSAHVKLIGNSKTVATDKDGAFSVQVQAGPTVIEISHTGYEVLHRTLSVRSDTLVQFMLTPKVEQLEEVVVSTARYRQSDQLQTTRMSSVTVTGAEINSIPVLGGEADLLKTIQLLPGVSKGVEGSTDIFVRGGAADQNLVLLDGAPVYNTGHLFGFLSVFNPDFLSRVESMNGAFPAEYGGRLSSILDVQTKSAFSDRTQIKGNVGIIASRLMIDQPLVRDKLSISVAGRRTYVDQVVRLLGQELPYHFYDLNAKVAWRPSTSDQVEFTHYSGDDVLNFIPGATASRRLQNTNANFTIGNSSQTLRWNRQMNSGWSSSLLAYRSKFRYTIDNRYEDSRLFTSSDIEDFGGKWVISSDSLAGLSLKGGLDLVRHQVSPNIISTTGEIAELLESTTTEPRRAWEISAFSQVDGDWLKRWRWSLGLRVSSAWLQEKNYINPEPRLSLRYTLNDHTTIKASYSRMAQYLHRVSSAAVAFPTDIWYPVTGSVKPQRSDQWSLAVQRLFPKAGIFLSAEAYYKTLDNLIGYREGANLFVKRDFEEQLIQGEGRSYGMEMLVKKETGRLTGWISYTLSWSERRFDELNGGDWFYARYDRRHNIAVVANYRLARKWSFSAVWEFISGSRFTPIIGRYTVPAPSLAGVSLIPVYAPINSVKLADTHRLDLGIKFKPSRIGKRFQGEWFFGVYNVYNRATPVAIAIVSNGDGTFRYEQPGVFGFLPFISYGFTF
ncbi:MAG: TonB-dependent receptor [Cyclobacteriaceae bacterium]|nr:TonB-dependent receptor [Cyclobacteriaceae bacterium]